MQNEDHVIDEDMKSVDYSSNDRLIEWEMIGLPFERVNEKENH